MTGVKLWKKDRKERRNPADYSIAQICAPGAPLLKQNQKIQNLKLGI